MTIYHTPKLGSPSDNEPNPFVDRPADRSGPSFPGVFDISRTSEPPATILEEPEEELNEDNLILITPLLDTNTNSTRPPPVSTTPPPQSPRNQRRMPSLLHMPVALSPSTPRWNGQARSLRMYIRLVERMLVTTKITDKTQKLGWLTEYIDPDINDQWTSFEEYAWGNWDDFLSHLRIEYPEITNEEQGSMDQLRWLCREIPEIGLAKEKRLLDFKRKFLFIVQKCLKPPAITGNRELVEHFVRCLDVNFREALNSRLSLQGQLKVDSMGRSHVEDPYNLEHVVEKTIELVSGKTIARAMQHSAAPVGRVRKIDPDLRALVLFTRAEAMRKVELPPDIESLQMDMNVLKTMYEKQEKGRKRHEKTIQSLVESMRSSVNRTGYQRDYPVPQNRYSGPSGFGAPRPSNRKCYYCFGMDHLLNCMVKVENEQKGLILVDGFTVRFTNGEPIPTDPNVSIRDCVKKHLLSSVAVMLMGDPDPELSEFLDREPDMGYNHYNNNNNNNMPRTILKRPAMGASRAEQTPSEVSQLKNKVKSLEVMLQKLQTDNEPEPEEDNMEVFLRHMAAEYT